VLLIILLIILTTIRTTPPTPIEPYKVKPKGKGKASVALVTLPAVQVL
jgi:hypothetical protein